MIKVYINNEEVLCDKNIVIKKEMLNTSSTILNNVYPKSWETTHDYTTNYYYPLDYSNCKITDVRDIPAEEGQRVEGTNFNIDVDLSKEYSFDEFKGNTTQNGTPTPSNPVNVNVVTGGQDIVVCGKNLFNATRDTATENGVTFTKNSDGTYTANGTATGFIGFLVGTIKFSTNTEVIYSGCPENGSMQTYSFNLQKVNGSVWLNDEFGNGRTATLEANEEYSVRLIIRNGVSVNNLTYKPMIRLSSISDDTYEEYKGNTYEINLGKNLFDINKYSNAILRALGTNVTLIKENDTTLKVLNKVRSTRNFCGIPIPNSSNLLGNTITVNADITINGNTDTAFQFWFMNSTSLLTEIGTAKKITSDGNQTYTATIPNTMPNNATGIAIVIYGSFDSQAEVNSYVTFNKIQIEKGSVATTFAPYKTPIELCKIGDYQDRIYKDSGKWYIEKQIGKVVLDGTQTIKKGGTTRNQYFYAPVLSNYIKPNNNDTMVQHYTNYFINKTPNQLSGGSVIGSAIRTDNSIGFAFGLNSEINTADKCKTWLSTHNITVYYLLATPTTTEITDTTLINQLESIELLEGTNNISSNGNLPIIMNLHYNYVTHRIDTTLLFSGIVKNTGNISLNPREPHYSSIEVLGYETFLSEGETLDFVIYEKTIEEAIDLVINTISDYGIIKGNINIKNPNDIIGAYSTKDKTAYDVFNYIADITQSRWTTRIIDENTIAIDFYDPDLMINGTNLDFTQEFFTNNNIIDMQYNYGTRDYRNKQVMNSNAVYSNIETNETIIADGYQTQFNTTDKIGQITKMTLNGNEVIVRTKDEYELGYTCDFYYTPGNNYFESVDLVSTGGILVIDYYAIIQGREILLNNTEINRVNSMTGRKGVISRYEDRNDATTTNELSQIGQSYLRYKGSPEIILTIESLNDIWNIGEKVEFNNAPLNELATEYMVKKKTIHYIPTVDNIFYEFELTSNFNSENAINYFDNQRSKNKGNIGQGETISRNIDISNTANVIFYDVDIQEVSVEDDNILNSTLNSPLVQ